MSDTTERPCTHTTNSSKKATHTHTHLLCVFRKCCICTHICRQCQVPTCMSDFFVCTANKILSLAAAAPPTHTHGRVWQLSAGLFIDVLPQRGRWSEGAQARERKKREKARSKERSELTGQVNHPILSTSLTHVKLEFE